MTRERCRLSIHTPVAQAVEDMLTRWADFAGLLRDGTVCLTKDAAERSLRGVAPAGTPG
jgi:transposase